MGKASREVAEEEVLAWLALGAASSKSDRPLLRPVVHAFVAGINGAVVTFPTNSERPRLWLNAEAAAEAAPEESPLIQLPVLSCTTCGQHYFTHAVADFAFFDKAPAGGQAVEDRSYWQPQDEALGGRRVVLYDRLVSEEEDAEEDDQHAGAHPVWLCRHCGALHPKLLQRCDGCGREDALVGLFAVRQKEDTPGKLTRCLSCQSSGRRWGGQYREPARPIRAVTVSDVHVLAQNMLQAAERKRLLVFADNRQDAAFQAGWIQDHARRFRLRALISDILGEGSISVGDLVDTLERHLARDDNLSKDLLPEVWRQARKDAAPRAHERERHTLVRILVLREIATGLKQRLGLEPWGRMKVEYLGLSPDLDFVRRWAGRLSVEPERLCEGISALLDVARRNMVLLDREGRIFSKLWMEGLAEIQQGYLPFMPSVPRGLKLRRAPGDHMNRITQWLSERGDTGARQAARNWGVPTDDIPDFLTELWQVLAEDLRLLAPVTLEGPRGGPLRNCSGAYQIDADKLILAAHSGVWRCSVCRRAQVRPTPHNACLAYRCQGRLVWEEEDPENYDLAVLDERFDMLRPNEHSAMVPTDKRERTERIFKSDSEELNTLVCTPTLELGVDIGSLDSVLMRNVPPLSANYWQRVGRAGRRQRMAANITYARTSSHDQAYFKDPQKLLTGLIHPPRFNLRNEVMIAKHVHAVVLTGLYLLAQPDSGLGEPARDEITATLDALFPTIVRDYLFDQSGRIREEATDVSPLGALIDKHRDFLLNHLAGVFSQYWPAPDAYLVGSRELAKMLAVMPAKLQGVVDTLKRRLDWAMRQQARLDEIKREHGVLDPGDEALERRCRRLIKQLRGELMSSKRPTQSFEEVNTYAVLGVEGFLPGYGLESGAIQATTQLPRRLGERDFNLPRPPSIALREYVPGNLIYANSQRFTPRIYHLSADDSQIEPISFHVDIANEAVGELGVGGGLGVTAIKAIPICDVELPHQSIISDEDEFRFQLPVAVWGYEQGRHDRGCAYVWGERNVSWRKGVHLRLVNIGPSSLVSDGRLGYPVCRVCGQSRSPFASEAELENFHEDHIERCGREVENIGFYADIVADCLVLKACADRTEAYSLAESLRLAASHVLDMEPEDLQLLALPAPGAEEIDIAIYDPMPGGSGLLNQMIDRWPDVIAAAAALTGDCQGACERSCIDCLQTFRNAFFHRYLDRHKAYEKIAEWGPTLRFTHDIPANLPTPVDESPPVNLAEQLFDELLRRADFPEPQREHRIILGPPLGSTTVDAFYPGEDEYEPGICIYIDGLSRAIHGDPKRSEQDRRIRAELRAKHYEVLEIPASQLTDKGAMVKHFSRLGRWLVGREKSRTIRENNGWFDEAAEKIGVKATPDSADGGGAPGTSVDRLTTEPPTIVPRSEAVPFVSHIPVYTLEAAAGKFGRDMDVSEEGWVEADGIRRKLSEDMFAAHVTGHSMEPRIPDNSLCLFRAHPAGSRQGKIVLAWHRGAIDPESGGEYTVKKYASEKTVREDGAWSHQKITLRPLNPDYEPLVLEADSEEDVRIIAEFLEVLA